MTQTRGKQLIIHVEFGQQSLLQKGNYSFQEKGYTNLLYKGILGGMEETVGEMNVRRKIFFVLMILWMVLIFSFSTRPAEVSSEDSRSVGVLIGEIFIPGFEGWSDEEQNAFAEKVDHPVRKTAHAAEYAVLGLLTAGAYIGGESAEAFKVNYKKTVIVRDSREKMSISRGIVIPWVITTAYAGTDELHQLFVPGRSGQVSDVLLDSAGALIGLAVLGGMRFLMCWRRENDCKRAE